MTTRGFNHQVVLGGGRRITGDSSQKGGKGGEVFCGGRVVEVHCNDKYFFACC